MLASESDVNIHIGKKRTTIGRLTTIWKSDLSDKMKQEFFQAVAIPVLLYGCITWMKIMKYQKIKLVGNYTRMLQAVLNKSCNQHFT